MKSKNKDLHLCLLITILAGIYAIYTTFYREPAITLYIAWISNSLILSFCLHQLVLTIRKERSEYSSLLKKYNSATDYCDVAYKYNLVCVYDLKNAVTTAETILKTSIERTPFEEIPQLYIDADLQIQEIKNRYIKT